MQYNTEYDKFVANTLKDYKFTIDESALNTVMSKIDSTKTIGNTFFDSLFTPADKVIKLATYKDGVVTLGDLIARADCLTCAYRSDCTRSATEPRMIHFRPQAEHEMLQTARQRQQTAEFKERYKKRAGIEGTLSQATRSFELRQARYIGLAKTHLQHVATAVAMNLALVAVALAWVVHTW